MDKEIIKKIIRNDNVIIYDGIKEWFKCFPFFELLKTIKYKNVQKKKLITNVICSLDIETSRVDDLSFCYIWQFNMLMNGIHHVILDRQIENTPKVFEKLYDLTKTKNECVFICAIHNLSYEFQFYKNLLKWKTVFAKEKRKPITASIDGVYFIDTLQISHKNLKTLGKEIGVQKLTEKMNYSKLRTSVTKMTNEEYAYCVNDVIIPVLYVKSLINVYVDKYKFFPITQTSKVRFKMKKAFKDFYGKRWKDISRWIGDDLYPSTFDEYKNEMKWLFRGAWTHGNPQYTGDVLKSVKSMDITSSYIYTMFCDRFPMEKFEETDLSPEKIDTDVYAFKGFFIFYNLRTKNNIAYESVHKSLSKNLINDNGKVFYASEMKVYLTDVDFDLYNKMYDFDTYDFFDLQISKKSYLPEYIIVPMISAYILKQKKKKNGEKYTTEKEEVNSFYGMMVTRIPVEESLVEEGEWISVERDKPYDDRYRSFLSPYWGIWVTAHSRKHLFDGIECFDKFYYSDTDSAKGICNVKKMMKLNDLIFENVQKSKNHFKITSSMVDDLGQWDDEGVIDLFKYQGSKRYICYKDGKTTATIAGCPKAEYQKHYSKHMFAKQFSEFNDMFSLNSVKLRSKYFDDTFELMVDGCFQKIFGCNTLIPTDFTMSLAGIYVEFLKYLKNKQMEGKDYGTKKN